MSESVNSSRRERLSSIPPFVIKATIAASLGGILFGYDMGVTSTALPQLKNTFGLSEKQEEIISEGTDVKARFQKLANIL